MKILSLIILCIVFAYNSFGQLQLDEDPTIRETFGKSEIEDLQLLFDFFNESICSRKNDVNLDSCYLAYLQKDRSIKSIDEIKIGLSFANQRKIYNKFQDSTFFEIWNFGHSWDHNNPTDTLRVVYLNPRGSYYEFLGKAGKDDPMIQSYLESVKSCGGICPSLIGGMIANSDTWNISDIRVKLLIAIHYLTLNDKYER